jgi:hypothetical protein
MSSCIADMLDRKEINALNYRTKAVYTNSRREITGVAHCITVHTQGVDLALLV